ncbi:unnamed protein product [Didymodactylos carnosus]|uniref:Uncharacterized protein n=1 Tax=Didymodactylos carnosus TaxID=1234261 RepID=A0A814URC5_9BILA|nr:unnamed protein product [Didymodactylos carnosus]CAF3939581.1 unnamed protein product [Didymodactylos carnosus]
MATKYSYDHKTKASNVSNRRLTNLETFSLLWLDANTNSTAENRDTQNQLRRTTNFLKTFRTCDECEEYIREVTDGKIVLIVKGIFVDAASLIRQVSSDQRLRTRTEELLAISVCSPIDHKAMETVELNNLQRNEGQLMSMNNFLSTTFDEQLVRLFADSIVPTDSIQRVLFEIKIDTRLDNRPFADISHLNISGSSKEANLLTAGTVLHNMGDYNRAKKYFNRVLNELKHEDINAAHCHSYLGTALAKLAEYDEALYHLNESVTLYKRFQYSDDICGISRCYYWMGKSVFKCKKEYKTALEYLEKALKIQEFELPADHVRIAGTLREIGNAHCYQLNYDLATSYLDRALKMYEKTLPSNHSYISSCYADCGSIHFFKKNMILL